MFQAKPIRREADVRPRYVAEAVPVEEARAATEVAPEKETDPETMAAMTVAADPPDTDPYIGNPPAETAGSEPVDAACMAVAIEPEIAEHPGDETTVLARTPALEPVPEAAGAEPAAAAPRLPGAIGFPAPPPEIFPPARECPANYERVTVPYGWDAGNVLVRYGISYQALQNANPEINLDALYAGVTLCIPPKGEAPGRAPKSSGAAYVMHGTDTIDTLVRRFHSNIAALLSANPTMAPQDFVVGSTVWIPECADSR